MSEIKLDVDWRPDASGRVVPVRAAEFWTPAPGGAVDCTLCYRRCRLADGEQGWCRSRINHGGVMRIPEYGVCSTAGAIVLGYGGGSPCYRPGVAAMTLGGVRCTAGCVFCMTADTNWSPERLSWAAGERLAGPRGGWNHKLGMLHPAEAIAIAERYDFREIVLWDNEPTLTIEYSMDVARRARAAGRGVSVYTNGLSTLEAIERLAPYVTAVNVGVKGSLDPAFYARWMKAPGAEAAVRASILAWRRTGVHVSITDLLATPHMQTRAAADAAWHALYSWLADAVDVHVPVSLINMKRPYSDPHEVPTPLMPARATDDQWDDYETRPARALAAARAVGLAYAHADRTIHCHACGRLILNITHSVFGWTHVAHVRGGCCAHCGVSVPIKLAA